MQSSRFYQALAKYRLLPILNGKNRDNVLKACRLFISTLPIIEITLRDDKSTETIKAAKENFPDLLIGAGTVIEFEDAKQAIKAGANFLVSPGLNEEIARYCQTQSIPYLPGTMTPTEILKAYNLGIKLLKLFPVESSGIKLLKTLDGPFGHYGIRFVPTGGINESNYLDYLKLHNVIAVGGSFIAPEKLLVENISAAASHINKIVKSISSLT